MKTDTTAIGEGPGEREFSFVLTLAYPTDWSERAADGLFEAGCDDATLASRHGRHYLMFSRVAATLREAILAAIRDIRSADVGDGRKAEVACVDACNLVTQADIARRIGRTRQLVHQYLDGTRGPGDFPPPVRNLAGSGKDAAPLWDWCEVARWLHENGIVRADVVQNAETTEAINAVLAAARLRSADPAGFEELSQALSGSSAAAAAGTETI